MRIVSEKVVKACDRVDFIDNGTAVLVIVCIRGEFMQQLGGAEAWQR